MKQEYLDKIKEFSSITITKICKDLNVNKGNLYNGNASLENTIRVWQKIEEELKQFEIDYKKVRDDTKDYGRADFISEIVSLNKDLEEQIEKANRLVKELKGSARYQTCMHELDNILEILKKKEV